MLTKEQIIERIDELIVLVKGYNIKKPEEVIVTKVLMGAMSLVKLCYGEQSKEYELLYEVKKLQGLVPYNDYVYRGSSNAYGILVNLKNDLNNGLLTSIKHQAIGVVYIDLVNLSKKLADENQKEASSVVACGAFEDCMKKYATENGLSVADADLSQVLNALKAASLLKGPQASVAKSYVQLRNKAFHAQWDKIDFPEIKSLIAFIEEFVLKHFSE